MLKKLQKFVSQQAFKRVLSTLIIFLTVVVFIDFFAGHPEYLDILRHIKLLAVIEILLLNILLIIDLGFIYNFSLQLCGKKMPVREQFLLTTYSSIANFFGPLQSGPAIRTVYLKTKHNIRTRDYVFATLIGYGMFASVSALFLIGGSRPWWQSFAATLAVTGISILVITLYKKKGDSRTSSRQCFHLRTKPLFGLLIATLVQVGIVTAYYFIELKAVNPSVTLHQAISYSGAANFALFVSITPDAVGFREAFLILSQHLHHISAASILAANVIDRAIYALFLVMLFVVAMIIHARDRLGIKQTSKD